MARRKHGIVGVAGPTTGGLNGPTAGPPEALDPTTGTVVAPGNVAIVSANPAVTFVALLNTDGGRPTGGGPRHDIIDRTQRTSVPEYKGHDPLRLSLSVILDGYRARRSVQGDLDLLYRLQDKRAGSSELPLLRVFGPVPFTDRRWSIDGTIEWDDDPTPVRDQAGQLLRLAVTIPLLERVPDTLLHTSIARSRRSGKGARNGPHYTQVHAGENDLGDVSKRLYGTRARAGELAQANNIAVGARLRRKQRIRVP